MNWTIPTSSIHPNPSSVQLLVQHDTASLLANQATTRWTTGCIVYTRFKILSSLNAVYCLIPKVFRQRHSLGKMYLIHFGRDFSTARSNEKNNEFTSLKNIVLECFENLFNSGRGDYPWICNQITLSISFHPRLLSFLLASSPFLTWTIA